MAIATKLGKHHYTRGCEASQPEATTVWTDYSRGNYLMIENHGGAALEPRGAVMAGSESDLVCLWKKTVVIHGIE